MSEKPLLGLMYRGCYDELLGQRAVDAHSPSNECSINVRSYYPDFGQRLGP